MLRRVLPKKVRELILLKTFLSTESLELEVHRIEESETPDFIVNLKEKIVSIELTQLIQSSQMKKEVFKDMLIERAYKLFKEKYNDELYVLISFNNVAINCRSKDISAAAQELSAMVEKLYLPHKDSNFTITTKPYPGYWIIAEKLVVSNEKGHESWQAFGAFKVKKIDIPWVKKTISEKEKMILKYDRSLDENWLLLIANFGFRSDTHNFYYLKQEIFESTFDRVYLYKYREREIIQLK